MFVVFVLAAALSEVSYTLPERRVPAPIVAKTVGENPVWSRSIDAPGDGDMLAIGNGVVAFSSHGTLCAYDDKTGSGVWCSGAGRGPVFASGTVAYATAGGIRAVDARSGAQRWYVRDGKWIWRTGNGFIVSSTPIEDRKTRTFSETVKAVGVDGVPRWSKTLAADGVQPIVTAQYLTWKTCGSGAVMHCYSTVGEYGAGILGQVDGEVLGVNGSIVVNDASFNEIEVVEDHSLVFNIGVFDSRSQRYAERYTYAPDYGTNYARWNANACSGQHDAVTSRLDGDALYLIVCRNLYRYALAPAASQKPLRIAGDVTFWGGPYRGTLYVERNDGLWALKPTDDDIGAQLVLPSRLYVQDFVIAAGMGFGIFRDGSVRGFDVDTGLTAFEARPCRSENFIPVRVAATQKRILIACAVDGAWTLYAYAR